MSDDNDNDESFDEFKGRPDPSEGGLTTSEMMWGAGFFLIVVG